MDKLKIAIIGAGNGGCAVAADLSYKGHDVTLVKTSNAMHDDNFNYLIENNGDMTLLDFGVDGSMDPTTDKLEKNTKIKTVTRDLSAISNADIIIIYVQTCFHKNVIERAAPYIVDGQIVIINPGYLSSAYLIGATKGKDITIVEAQSSFIDGRIIEPGKFRVGFRNARNPLGIYPKRNAEYAKEKLTKLGFPFHFLNHIVEASLHNPNMIVHTVGSLMSIPMIDSMGKDFCMYHYSFTPHVWNVLEKLDEEKMNILEKLGCPRLSYVDACKFRNSVNLDIDGKKVFFEYASMPTRAKAPSDVNSRYITEDVPQGLVMLESLGKYLGVKTPVATALIEIANAALGRDFRVDGRTPDSLGWDNLKAILED